jgi:phosphoribosylpyrophosphate synthetase
MDAAKRASARHITAVIPYFDGLDRKKTNLGFRYSKPQQLLETAGATR